MTARPLRTRLAPDIVSDDFRTFWAERRLGTLVTLREDGTPHVVPVGVTVDVEHGLARVICRGGSQKARNVVAAGSDGARVAVSQAEGRRWSTLEGVAVVRDDPESVRDAEQRYAARYRVPRVNPERVVIEIRVDRVLGMV
ncbi:TIGR03618 family F420-dependent PPOX class oxidoreductase [Pseudonocardia sp. RS11V-5]|uniref:TIGR03618 family F420-dependent PPOX class oxidoreductase n=1 Tax=Pseudonocardia terrae TaxID=2905831 RepID=UPI001E2D7795|nr:TIGR03618 family F420-dependent PPOX class oxidoreductase [Pseudonocardia terrae]MCE3551557.1 TIGR03618 family F420-dependent PPOX class oxidoreductase [Pseudonocardia terrae]